MDFERSEMKLSEAARARLRNAVAAEFAAPSRRTGTDAIRGFFAVRIPAYQIAAVILVLAIVVGVKNWRITEKNATSAPISATSISTVDGANEGAHNVNFL